MKSFGGAQPYIFVDPQHIKDARNWLAQHQRPDGCISSVGKLFHNGMKVTAPPPEGPRVALSPMLTLRWSCLGRRERRRVPDGLHRRRHAGAGRQRGGEADASSLSALR